MPSRVGMTGCSPTCIWVVSQDLLISSPTFPSAPIQEGIGCRGGREGGSRRETHPPFESGFFELCVWGKFLWILS